MQELLIDLSEMRSIRIPTFIKNKKCTIPIKEVIDILDTCKKTKRDVL